MAYPGVSIQGVGDAGDGVPARANPVRQSKLSYGQVALHLHLLFVHCVLPVSHCPAPRAQSQRI
jgi:hypothetical protein